MRKCGVCHTNIADGCEIVLCPSDKTPYHRKCWEYNKGCGVLGCRHNPSSVSFVRSSPRTMVYGKQVQASNNSIPSKFPWWLVISLFF